MIRYARVLGLLGGWAVAAAGVDLHAQTPDVDHYRFLPRHSVLRQSGGIAGVEINFRVMGKFDFERIPFNDIQPFPYLAKFTNVDAWANHPVLAYSLPLDETLNLSGLVGRQLPVAAPFDVFQFKGKTSDGSAVDLLAAQIGPWLRLYGKTTAPVDSEDLFEYELRALARRKVFADFNEDDVVDRHDLARWAARYGLDASAINGLSNDADGDGNVDGTDFLAWQRQVGEAVPSLAGIDAMIEAALAAAAPAGNAAIAAVPEPQAIGLAVVGLAWLISRRSR